MLVLLAAQIATRMYGYPSRPNNDEDYMQLLPIFDMANCADQGNAATTTCTTCAVLARCTKLHSAYALCCVLTGQQAAVDCCSQHDDAELLRQSSG